MSHSAIQATIDEQARKALEIYNRLYRAEFECHYHGQYVVIDLNTETAFRSVTPEGAMEIARQTAPYGVFHLIRVGFSTAFIHRG